jgi:hypothetical protein
MAIEGPPPEPIPVPDSLNVLACRKESKKAPILEELACRLTEEQNMQFLIALWHEKRGINSPPTERERSNVLLFTALSR